MSETLEPQTPGHQELFQSMCQEFSSAKVVELLVTCFGEELTGEALDMLGASSVVPGVQLVKIYATNRNFEYKGERS